jgi:copper oxidase (laccase) domain-containing protein
MRTDTKKDSHYITIPALERTGVIRHAFTTRANGLGRRNKGAKSPDDWNAVATAFGTNTFRLVTVDQVHGENIVKVDALNYRDVRTVHADAMITDARTCHRRETADWFRPAFDPAKPAGAACGMAEHGQNRPSMMAG